MKIYRIAFSLILLSSIFGFALADGILPTLTETIGKPMPSIGSILNRYPDQEIENGDGSVSVLYANVSETDYNGFSILLKNKGAELVEYSVDGADFIATVLFNDVSFIFRYNIENTDVLITYPTGAYDEYLKTAKTYYAKGETLLASENFADAEAAFALAGDYKDAAERVPKAWYEKGENLLVAGDYDSAVSAFEKAGDFSDAKERILEVWYTKGETLLALEKYADAETVFEKAGNYKDAAERMPKAWYSKGEVLLSSKDYDGAIQAFEKAGNYSNAAELISKTWYEKGKRLIELGSYNEAENAFVLANSYLDSEKQIKECKYCIATNNYSAGNYSNAMREFAKLSGYKDSDHMVIESKYQYACSLIKNKEYDEAVQVFWLLNGYKDVHDIIVDDANLLYAMIAMYYKVGDIVDFGNYNKAKLKWYIYKESGSNRFLITTEIVEEMPYNNKNTYTGWGNSSLRKWLNGTFYNKAFNTSEKKVIAKISGTYDDKRTKNGKAFEDKVSAADYAGVDTTYDLPRDVREGSWWSGGASTYPSYEQPERLKPFVSVWYAHAVGGATNVTEENGVKPVIKIDLTKFGKRDLDEFWPVSVFE